MSRRLPAPTLTQTPPRWFTVVLLSAVAASLLPFLPAGAAVDATPARISGADRIHTAAAVARLAFPAGAAAAVLATASDFPDALAGAGLAGAVGGPVLLTHAEEVPVATRQVLEELGTETVYLLGGEAAIGDAVAADLEQRFAVERVAGPTRYATAAEVARVVATQVGIGVVGRQRTVLVTSGRGFADALAAGPAAFARHLPVLLTDRDALPPETADAIEELEPTRAVVVGGSAVVSDAVVGQLQERGIAPLRLAGATRASTATQVADWAHEALGFPNVAALLTSGDGFADALTAAPLAGRLGAPILLVGEGALGDATRNWLTVRCPGVRDVRIVGGRAAVGDAVVDEGLQAARHCGPEGAPFQVTFSVTVASADENVLRAFSEVVAGTLTDPRGWQASGAVQATQVPTDGDVQFHLGPVSGDGCASGRHCRAGDRLLVHEPLWAQPPQPWTGGDTADYRAYVLNHLFGLWLGLVHDGCRGVGDPAPVMADQADGNCRPNPWPLATELSTVRRRYRPAITAAFGGDVMGERPIRDVLESGGNPLADVSGLLTSADLAVVNLETAVGSSGRPANKTFTFQAPPSLVTALSEAGVDVVNLANNHALDYGVEGLVETIDLARGAGLEVVGAGRDATEAYAPAVVDVDGRRVAVVGLSRVLPPGWAAGPGSPGVASAYDEQASVAAVRAAAEQADHVLVAIHWGLELAECPAAHQLHLARVLVEAGADVVAGHHPHILQGIQQRGDALVAYSLGNFVWYHRREPSRYTGVLTVTVTALGVTDHTFAPAEIAADGGPRLLHGEAAAAVAGMVTARSPGGGRCGFS